MEKQLPKNWINVYLQDVTKNVKGKKPKIQSEVEFDGSVPYMDIKALEYNEIRQFADIESSKHFEEGDVAMVWDGARSGWVSKTNFGAIGSTLVAFKPIKINSNYLFYYLLEKYPFINSNARGVGIPHVDPTVLWSLDFPLPPLPEQNRIVTKLDALFAQLETIKSNMATVPLLLKDFRQQVLTQAVTGKLTKEWRKGKKLNSEALLSECQKIKDNLIYKKIIRKEEIETNTNLDLKTKIPSSWITTNLNSLCVKITQGPNPNISGEIDSNYRLLKTKDFYNNVIHYDKCQFLSNENYEEFKRFQLKTGDVILGLVGVGSTGKCNVFEEQENYKYIFTRATGLIRVLDSKLIKPKFIHFFLNSSIGENVIEGITEGTTGQLVIKTSNLKKIDFPLPTSEEQQEIVYRVESLFAKADDIEKQYESLKAKIDNLPQALLHKAFKGELTEQWDSDGDARELLKEIEALKAQTVKSKTKKIPTKKVTSYSKKEEVLGMVAEANKI